MGDDLRRITPPLRVPPKMPSHQEELVSRLTSHYSNFGLRSNTKLLRGRARAGANFDRADWESVARMIVPNSTDEFSSHAQAVMSKIDRYRSDNRTPEQNRQSIADYEAQRLKDRVSLPVPDSGITSREELYEKYPRVSMAPDKRSSYLMPLGKPRPRTISGLGALAGGILAGELTKRFKK